MPVPRQHAALPAPVQQGVNGDKPAGLMDADLVGGGLDLEHARARAVWDAVEVACHRDESLVAETALDAQHGVQAPGRQAA